TVPDVDRRAMDKIREMTSAELISAERGRRKAQLRMTDLIAVLALGDWETAARLTSENPQLMQKDGAAAGALHLMAKRGDARAVKWLLDHGAGPKAHWAQWDSAVVTVVIDIFSVTSVF